MTLIRRISTDQIRVNPSHQRHPWSILQRRMRELIYLQAMTYALRDEMRRDPGVFVPGEDIACSEEHRER
jgi:hypothetical protein